MNPEFVARTIAQLMIKPGYVEVAGESLAIAKDVLEEILQPLSTAVGFQASAAE